MFLENSPPTETADGLVVKWSFPLQKYTVLFAAVASLAVASAASAQSMPTQAYVSLSGGVSHINADCSGTSACNDNGTAAKLLVGYKIIPNLALEASLGYLGKATATVPYGGSSVDASIKGRSVGFGVAAFLPFGVNSPWTGIARLGVASVRTTVGASSSGVSGSDADTKAQAYVGLGVNYAFASNVELGLAYDSSRIEYSGQKATASSFNVVGTFKF